LNNGDLEEEDAPVFARLGEIAVPAALLVGDADYPPLVEANKEAAAAISGCEFTMVPGMDHLPPLREPDLVLAAIRKTLSRAGW
jgi:pimeloyl-ACP methyl ester carboxylesterase